MEVSQLSPHMLPNCCEEFIPRRPNHGDRSTGQEADNKRELKQVGRQSPHFFVDSIHTNPISAISTRKSAGPNRLKGQPVKMYSSEKVIV